MSQTDYNDARSKDVSVSKLNQDGFSLNVTVSKLRRNDSALLKSYNIEKYLDPRNFIFTPETEKLIPKDVPAYLDNGQKYVERMARALCFFKQCALIGPSGTGKTHVVYLVAELAKLPLWEINCSLQTSVFDLFGRYVGLGKENWIDGQIVSWCRHGGILYLDEANMMKQDIATRLNPILDARGHLVLTEKDNEIVPRHKDAFLVISMNPYANEFSGTKPLNAAFRRRMSVWLNFDYMSAGDKIDDKELALLTAKTNIDRKTAENILRVGAELRKLYKTGDLPYAPSVGDLVNWSMLIADGSPVMEASQDTIVGVISDDPEIQDMVKKLIHKTFNK